MITKRHRVRKKDKGGKGRGKGGLSELRVLLAIMDSTEKAESIITKRNERNKLHKQYVIETNPNSDIHYIQTHTIKKGIGITNVNPFLTRLGKKQLKLIEQKYDKLIASYFIKIIND